MGYFVVLNLTFSNTSNHNILVNNCTFSVNYAIARSNDYRSIGVKSRFLRNDYCFCYASKGRSTSIKGGFYVYYCTFSDTCYFVVVSRFECLGEFVVLNLTFSNARDN